MTIERSFHMSDLSASHTSMKHPSYDHARKRLCYLAPDVPIPSPRGSSVHVVELSRHLNLLGYDVHVICRRTRQDEPEFEKLDGFSVHRIYRFIVRPGATGKEIGRTASEAKAGLAGRLYYFYLRTVFCLYV